MTTHQPALQIEGLTYCHRTPWTGKEVIAVENLSLSVLHGESFGFLGHNGAGKTSTIKAILGLTNLKSGTINIFGRSHTLPTARALIGYLPEQPYFSDFLTVHELLSFHGDLSGIPSKKLPKAVSIALDRVQISSRQHARMRTLSKGLSQRVAMAQAIVAQPKLLILDEPFSGLDPLGRKLFKDLLYELKKEGTTLFISSHILEDIEFLCDRASIMVNGKLKANISLLTLEEHIEREYELIIETPTPEGFSLETYANDFEKRGASVRYSFRKRTDAEQALSAALQHGATISQYQAIHGTLENLFVKLVQEERPHEK